MDKIVDIKNYFQDLYNKSKKTEDIDKLTKRIDLLTQAYNDLQKLYDTKFEKIEMIDLSLNDEDKKYLTDRLSLLGDNVVIDKVLVQVKLLKLNFDGQIHQFKDAHEIYNDVLSEFKYLIRKMMIQRKELEQISSSENLDKIIQIFKSKSDGSYKLYGNITPEEFKYIVEELEKSDLDLETINDFLIELNLSIAEYIDSKNKMQTAKEQEERKEELVKITKEEVKKEIIEDVEVKEFKGIYKVIKKLKQEFGENPTIENPKVLEQAPYETVPRTRLYIIPGTKDYDFNIVLYDLLNYIEPKKIYTKYLIGKNDPLNPEGITTKQYSNIKDGIYRRIKNKYSIYLKSKGKEELEEEITEEIKQEEIKEEPKEEVKPYYNSKVQPISDEDKKIIDEVDKIALEVDEAISKFGRISEGVLFVCYQTNETHGYPIDLDLLNIKFGLINKFKTAKKDYESSLNNIRTRPDFSEDIFLEILESYKDDLLKLCKNIKESYEIYKLSDEAEEQENEISDSNIKNLILLYNGADEKVDVEKDIEDVVATGQVNKEQVLEGLKQMEYLNIQSNSHNVSKVKTNLFPYKIYRYRRGDIRIVYIDVMIGEENRKELALEYGINPEELRLLLVPTIFYKRGKKTEYDEALSKIYSIKGIDGNDTGSIEWIRKLFREKFTDKTRKIAYDLIEKSENIKNKDGGNFGL